MPENRTFDVSARTMADDVKVSLSLSIKAVDAKDALLKAETVLSLLLPNPGAYLVHNVHSYD